MFISNRSSVNIVRRLVGFYIEQIFFVIFEDSQVGVPCTQSASVLFFTGLECFIIVYGIYCQIYISRTTWLDISCNFLFIE